MPEDREALIPGPWAHRSVSAAGTRFHVAEAGEGPLVLLLHGFPQFWWAWRHQLPVLARAGYRAVAVDLRGYGASDKPPRGYDLITLAGDTAGLIRALGEARATIVGHGVGGLVGWTAARYFPGAVRRLAVLSMPHPLRLRSAVLGRGTALAHLAGAQVPVLPERRLLADGAARVGGLLRAWSAPGWPDPETEQTFRDAFSVPGTAHCSLEYLRWLVRSQARPDGHRYMLRMSGALTQPVLHLHGGLDPLLPPAAARGSGRYARGPYRWEPVEGAGHFPHEERPERVAALLLDWLHEDGS
ncbi:alpha/beta fold hydrolase [Murinocardiopsis flavida]|nr:alpha/beta hydrolase [Murinocardiopsis flavida]